MSNAAVVRVGFHVDSSSSPAAVLTLRPVVLTVRSSRLGPTPFDPSRRYLPVFACRLSSLLRVCCGQDCTDLIQLGAVYEDNLLPPHKVPVNLSSQDTPTSSTLSVWVDLPLLQSSIPFNPAGGGVLASPVHRGPPSALRLRARADHYVALCLVCCDDHEIGESSPRAGLWDARLAKIGDARGHALFVASHGGLEKPPASRRSRQRTGTPTTHDGLQWKRAIAAVEHATAPDQCCSPTTVWRVHMRPRLYTNVTSSWNFLLLRPRIHTPDYYYRGNPTAACPLPVLFGVNKPFGLPCQSHVSNYKESLQAVLSERLHTPVWVAHRLDVCVTGLVLLARTKTALRALHRLFRCETTRHKSLGLKQGYKTHQEKEKEQEKEQEKKEEEKEEEQEKEEEKEEKEKEDRLLHTLLWESTELRKLYRAVVTNATWLLGAPLPWTLRHFMLPGATFGRFFPRLLANRQQEPGWRLCVCELVSARPANLSLELAGEDNELVELEVRLLTGRRHQIRSQLAAIGTPVFRDTTYAPVRGLTVMRGLGDAAYQVKVPTAWPPQCRELDLDNDKHELIAHMQLSKEVVKQHIGLHSMSVTIGSRVSLHASPPWWTARLETASPFVVG